MPPPVASPCLLRTLGDQRAGSPSPLESPGLCSFFNFLRARQELLEEGCERDEFHRRAHASLGRSDGAGCRGQSVEDRILRQALCMRPSSLTASRPRQNLRITHSARVCLTAMPKGACRPTVRACASFPKDKKTASPHRQPQRARGVPLERRGTTPLAQHVRPSAPRLRRRAPSPSLCCP